MAFSLDEQYKNTQSYQLSSRYFSKMLDQCQKLVFYPYSNVPISVRLYEHVHIAVLLKGVNIDFAVNI